MAKPPRAAATVRLRILGLNRWLQRSSDSRVVPPPLPTPLPGVASSWHDHGMARTRLSTTVDRELLDGARKALAGTTDAELIDEALTALLARYRTAEIDQAYATAYGAHPIDEPDEWGDLASFRDAAAAT